MRNNESCVVALIKVVPIKDTQSLRWTKPRWTVSDKNPGLDLSWEAAASLWIESYSVFNLKRKTEGREYFGCKHSSLCAPSLQMIFFIFFLLRRPQQALPVQWTRPRTNVQPWMHEIPTHQGFAQIIATIWSHYLKGSHVNWTLCSERKENGNKWALCFSSPCKFAPLSSLCTRTIKELLVSVSSPVSVFFYFFFEGNIPACWMFSLAETKPSAECSDTPLKNTFVFQVCVRNTSHCVHESCSDYSLLQIEWLIANNRPSEVVNATKWWAGMKTIRVCVCVPETTSSNCLRTQWVSSSRWSQSNNHALNTIQCKINVLLKQ